MLAAVTKRRSRRKRPLAIRDANFFLAAAAFREDASIHIPRQP